MPTVRPWRGIMGGKKGAACGNGESHNVRLESEKRMTKLIAKDISALIVREGSKRWYLAAPGEMGGQILESIDPSVKNKLIKNIAEDLTKTRKSEIMSHFETLV